MQVTGNSLNREKKILSIRLTRSGLYFYYVSPHSRDTEFQSQFTPGGDSVADLERALIVADARTGGDYDRVELSLDTAAAAFVPEELVAGLNAEEFLSHAGVGAAIGMRAVTTGTYGGICAVAYATAHIMEYMEERFAGKLAVVSPAFRLLGACREAGVEGGALAVYPTEENVYVAGYGIDGKLSLLEVYPLSGEADMVYYLSKLAEGMIGGGKGGRVKIYLYGAHAGAYRSVVRRYFRKVSVVGRRDRA